MFNIFKRIGNFWRYVIKHFINDNCTYRASALAFTTILSVVPLLTVGFTVLIFIPLFNSFNDQIQTFIFQHFLPSSGETIQHYLQEFISQTAKLSWIGIIFLLATVILTLYTIESSLNEIWRVIVARSWLKRFCLYWILMIFMPLIFGASFIISIYLRNLPYASNAIIITLPFIFSAAAFTFLYKALPSTFVAWKHSILGGLTAAILFEITKLGFTWYLIQFPTYELLYGALAAIPMFLTWIYLCWLIILFGAEVSHALSQETTLSR